MGFALESVPLTVAPAVGHFLTIFIFIHLSAALLILLNPRNMHTTMVDIHWVYLVLYSHHKIGRLVSAANDCVLSVFAF